MFFQEASRPPPGQAEKEELVRTSSAPSDLPLSQDPPVMQTSGLDWSGSVDGATLIQDLGQVLEQYSHMLSWLMRFILTGLPGWQHEKSS